MDALKPFLGGTGNGSTSSPAEKGLKRSYEDFSWIDLLKTCPDFGDGLIFVCAIVSGRDRCHGLEGCSLLFF